MTQHDTFLRRIFLVCLFTISFSGFSQTYNYSYTIGTTGVSGNDNSHFNQPTDIAFDSSDNVYIGDRNNQRVQIFDINGTYSNSFNSGSGNFNFNFVEGVAIDASDNIYVLNDNTEDIFKYDSGFNYVTKISHNGVLDISSNGTNVYATYYNNHLVRTFNGNLSQVASFGTGVATSSNNGFSNPTGVAADAAGNIYIADTNNHRIQIVNSSGNYVATLGVTGVSGSDNSHFNQPRSVAIDPTNGNILVADSFNYRVQVFDSSYNYVTTIGGNGSGSANNQFSRIDYINVDSTGKLYVGDRFNHRVQVFSNAPLSIEKFNVSLEVSWSPNPVSDILYFKTNSNNNTIKVFDTLGKQLYETSNQTQQFSINMKDYQSGIYFIQITTPRGKGVARIVKS